VSTTVTPGQRENAKTEVFISHITEEAAVAAKLKEAIGQDFLNLIDVFVSSDSASIAAGDDWLTSIHQALDKAAILITLCSPESIMRPWIHFEAGAAWMTDRPIIPLCHGGLTPSDLPMPLSTRHGLLLGSAEGLRRLYGRLADLLHSNSPNRDFEALANELASFHVQVTSDQLHQLNRNREIQKRLVEAVSNPDYSWRTLKRVAVEAAVSEEVAADFLRARDEIRFSRNRAGDIIVGLISRVGPRRRRRTSSA
jgi:TIR domain